MFEDFKHKIAEYNKETEKPLSATLASDVLEKCKQQGIDPDNVTLQQLFPAELYTSQTHSPFYLVTSNPQLIRGNLNHWKIKRVGHGSHGKGDTRINRELINSNSRRRLSVSMVYDPSKKSNKPNLY
jgi:hypothetical protein